MDQDETWDGGRPRPHCVRWGPSSLPKRGTGSQPQFSAHIRCGQMAGWIKMPIGTKVGLGPGNIVLDGGPSSPKKKVAQPPIFGPCVLWPNGWVNQHATCCAGRPRPRRRYVRWGRSSPQKGGTAPQFSARVYCGYAAGWIKMPLRTEVGLAQATLC